MTISTRIINPFAAAVGFDPGTWPAFESVAHCPLPHPDRADSPALIGFDANGQIAVELIYGADDWLAQYVIAPDGTIQAQQDEDFGQASAFEPLDWSAFADPRPTTLPDNIEALNFAGGRWRGLRETDRVPEVLHPLTIPEKLALATEGFGESALGLVESRIVAAATLPGGWLLCRQVRVAFSVPYARDAEGLPYDYDSRRLHFIQWVPTDSTEPSESLDRLLARSRLVFGAQPSDLLYDSARRRLFVIDDAPTADARVDIFRFLEDVPHG